MLIISSKLRKLICSSCRIFARGARGGGRGARRSFRRRGGGPDAAVAVVGAAGEDAGAVFLDVAGAGDVLAVVAPVSRGAEALRPKLALEDPGHLDAVVGLQRNKLDNTGLG